MTDDPAKPPRFPYIAAILCAGCVGAAAWTWMRYSYAWDVKPEDVLRMVDLPSTDGHPLLERYVCLHGDLMGGNVSPAPPGRWITAVGTMSDDPQCVTVKMGPDGRLPAFGSRVSVKGRVARCETVMLPSWPVCVDTTASRFIGASVAGLVVGAMGVLVFTVALRHWLQERKVFREDAARA